MPTISDLKDQARTLEQQGQIDRALTIYQHILKHLDGTPAITKVLPLYVKAGDLLHKLDRPDEAVASYQTAAEHYAKTGAAPRVTALCGKILRLAPARTDVYTDFVRQLIRHGHVGSARDVLADYARFAGMDRATETLDDLAGRPNTEVQPMLERLLDSLEMNDQSEQTAARVSSHLEHATDVLAGELSTVPETTPEDDYQEEQEEEQEEEGWSADEHDSPEEEAETAEAGEDRDKSGLTQQDASEPLTPPMFDLDHLPRQSSLHKAIEDYDDAGPREEEGPEEECDSVDTGADTPLLDSDSGFDITRDVTPTMPGMPVPAEAVEGIAYGTDEDRTAEDDELDSLLAEAMSAEETPEAEVTAEAPDAVETETPYWTPDYTAPQAEDTVAAEWAPEEELQPAARYPSDEYDTPATEDESADEEEVEEEIEAEAEAPEEPSAEVEVSDEDTEADFGADQPSEPVAEKPEFPLDEAVSRPEDVRRPSRPPRMMVQEDSTTASKSPIMFGIGGFVVGALAGAGLTFVLLGGGSGSPPTQAPVELPAAVADTPATQVQAPRPAEPEPVVSAPVQTEAASIDTTDDSPTDAAGLNQPAVVDSGAPEETAPEADALEAATQQPTDAVVAAGNPIIVEGMQIDEISEIEFRGLSGFRVVHLLDWGDPIVIEAYRDTSVTLSAFIQVNVTPPDTVVGIRRLDGYMVYASGVMPEDSIRSLMSRLVEGERQ